MPEALSSRLFFTGWCKLTSVFVYLELVDKIRSLHKSGSEFFVERFKVKYHRPFARLIQVPNANAVCRFPTRPFYLRGIAPNTDRIRGPVGPRAGLGAVEKRKVSSPGWKRKRNSSAVEPAANRYRPIVLVITCTAQFESPSCFL